VGPRTTRVSYTGYGTQQLDGEWYGKNLPERSRYPGIQGYNVTALRIASKPAANEIALIVTDDYGQVTGLIWSGSAWANEKLFTSTNNQFSQAIAVEYQQTGTYAAGRLWPGARATMLIA